MPWLRHVLSISALGGAASVLWAAYTYSAQQAEQRRKDFLDAYNLVAGDLGSKILKDVSNAIDPFIKLPATGWKSAADCYQNLDSGKDDPRCLAEAKDPEEVKQKFLDDMQRWTLEHVLVNDKNIHNYRYAENDLRFLYQYAKTDPCNWVVVTLKFQKNMDDFWYYYPGAYDFSSPEIKPLAKPEEAKILVKDAETKAIGECLESFDTSPSNMIRRLSKTIAPLVQRIGKTIEPVVAGLRGMF
jgi:hypothetical protein